eukprot:249011_1
MSILDDESNADVISWLPEGKGFIILDKKRFAEEVMPRYFNDTKFASFIRRLNRWCFIHRPKGNCQSQYFHPWFIKGDLHKCLQIRPKPQVSYKKKKKAAEEAQENHEALFSSQSMMMPQQGSLGQGQMGQFMQSGLQNSMSAANAMHQNNLYPTFPRTSNFDSASLMPSHGMGHNQMAASRIAAGYAPVGFTLPTPQANPQYPQYIIQGGANAMPQLSNFSQQPSMQRIMNLPEPRMPGLPNEPTSMNNNSMFNSSLRNPYDMRGMQGMQQMNREQQQHFQPNKNNLSQQNNEMQNLQFMANHQQSLHSNSVQNNRSPAHGGAQYQEPNSQDRHNL